MQEGSRKLGLGLKISGALSMALMMSMAPALAEDKPQDFDVLKLTDELYVLRSNSRIGNPTTVVSTGPDGVFVVDPNLDLVASTLVSTIESLGSNDIRYVTASHHHGDHSENFELLSTLEPRPTLFVPHQQRERLATGSIVRGERPIKASALPLMTFEGTLTLRFNGDVIDVMTLPTVQGHTDGDAIVYFRNANVLYVGDYFFLDRFPIVDESGDLDGFLANIAYMLKAFPENATVIPGHGRFSPDAIEAPKMADFQRNYDALKESVAVVRQQLQDGRTAGQIVERGLPDPLKAMGERPRYLSEERWIRFVVEASEMLPD